MKILVPARQQGPNIAFPSTMLFFLRITFVVIFANFCSTDAINSVFHTEH